MTPTAIEQLSDIVGKKNLLYQKSDIAAYLEEPRKIYQGTAMAVVRPGCEKEICDIVKICELNDISIVPHGGNTGLVGAQTPVSHRGVIVSMQRMNQIKNIDVSGKSVVVEAGVVLENLNQKLEKYSLRLPVHIGSQASCQIGGLTATNAGGINVLAYGNMRAQILDIEVITGGAKKIGGLKALHKNNTGYDLKQLFIGAEGTLGIITAICLKLQNLPRNKKTFLIAVENIEKALQIYHNAQKNLPGKIEAFELIKDKCIEFLQIYKPQTKIPNIEKSPYYILTEVSGNLSEDILQTEIENYLADAIENQIATDALIAKNSAEVQQLWDIRHNIAGGAFELIGEVIAHDIAVPLANIARFVKKTEEKLKSHISTQIRVIEYGHLGDGNLHYNVVQPQNWQKNIFRQKKNEINSIVYESVLQQGGTISAEHGIGLQKKNQMKKMKNQHEIEIMKNLKKIFDPKNIFNPQKLLPE